MQVRVIIEPTSAYHELAINTLYQAGFAVYLVNPASSLSDYGNRRQKLAAQSQILPIFYVNIEHIDLKMGEIWVVQADFEPI